jgi:glycosyltransferase involved in cell wall biosynthesis
VAADLRADRLWLPDLGDAFMGNEGRQRVYVEHLVKLVQEERLQALHVYGAHDVRPLVGAYAAARCEVPLAVSFRGGDLEQRIFGRNLAPVATALNAAQVCTVNRQGALPLVQRLFRPPCPLRVVPNSVDALDFDDLPPARLPLPRPLVGCVGEFRRVVGLDFLLAAFDQLAGRRPLSLVLIGPMRPLEASYYNGLLESLVHRQNILRLGPVPHGQMLSHLAACDLMVCPSTTDSAPNKVLEAMLAGRPLVASRVGGIPELVRDGQEALLVDPRDVAGLARAMERLLDEPELAASLGRAAQQRAREEFPPQRERQAWLEVYGDLGLCA